MKTRNRHFLRHFPAAARIVALVAFALLGGVRPSPATVTGFPTVWSFEPLQNTDSEWWQCLRVQTVPGVLYHLQKTETLRSGDWEGVSTIYGTGMEWICPLRPGHEPPVPLPPGSPVPPHPAAPPMRLAFLLLERTTAGVTLLSWISLDDGSLIRMPLPGTDLDPIWDEFNVPYFDFAQSHFFALSPRLGSPVNFTGGTPALGALDTAMLADFLAALPDITEKVENGVAAAAHFDPAAVPSAERAFFRIAADWTLDSDGDGRFDWQELAIDGGNPFAADSDGVGHPDLPPPPVATPLMMEGEIRTLEGEVTRLVWGEEEITHRSWTRANGIGPGYSEEAPDAGTPSAAAVNSGIGASPWAPFAPGTGPLLTGEWKQNLLGTSAASRQDEWIVLGEESGDFEDIRRAGRKDKRMRLHLPAPAPASKPHREIHLKIGYEGPMNEGFIPDEMTVEDVGIAELTIPAGQTVSDWLTVEAETKTGIHRVVRTQPLDITVVCGITAEVLHGPEEPDSSRKLLVQYLDGIKVGKEGNIWAVKGKSANGNERIYGVQVADDEATLLEALQADGRIVIYDGHANFGLGPNFTQSTHKTIADFTNFGVKYTDIPQDYRGNGTERDMMFYLDDPDPPALTEDEAITLDHIHGEGWGYLVLQPGQIQDKALNYKLPFIGDERFPNAGGIAPNQFFTKQGEGFNNEWHFHRGSSKRLMVTVPGDQVPKNLRYKTFFYNSCSSGPHFIENFRHGEFVYTNQACAVYKGTKIFVKGIVEGKNTSEIIDILHVENASTKGVNTIVYGAENFPQ